MVANLIEHLTIKEYLQVNFSELNNLLPEKDNFKSFKLNKRNGGFREITYPTIKYKLLLRQINSILNNYYNPSPSAHGYIHSRNIVTNAKNHLNKQKILSLDIKDFFPSITYSRVKELFTCQEFGLIEEEITLISLICTYKDKLPIGFPTSPIISNFLCRSLDENLENLALDNKLVYSRYADDIVFSSEIKDINNSVLPEIETIIENSGFVINNEKIKYKGKHRKQIITGIIVNDKLSVKKSFKKSVKALLYKWEKYGYEYTSTLFLHKSNKQSFKKEPTFYHSLLGKIEFIGFVCGKENNNYLNYKAKYNELVLRDTINYC